MTEPAMVLSEPEWEALAGVCRHYLYATRWADDPEQVPAGKDVLVRREVCARVAAAVPDRAVVRGDVHGHKDRPA